MATLLLVLFLLFNQLQADSDKLPLPVLSNDALYSFVGRPVCAFFNRPGTSDYEDLLLKFLQDRSLTNSYQDWIIGSVDLKDITQLSPPPSLYPTVVPSLQCDIGLPIPLEYIFQDRTYKSLKKWFKSLARKLSKQPQIISLSSLENAIFNNSKGITVVILPGVDYFQYVEEIVLKLKKMYTYGAHLEIFISQSASPSDRELQEWFGLMESPTLLFFTYKVWVEKKMYCYMLHGLQEITLNSIELSFKIISMKVSFLDEKHFHDEVLDTKYQLPPKLVCVFSNSNPRSLMYLLKFEEIKSQLECQGAQLEFRLMNIGEKNVSNVFTRHVNASGIKGFPVFIVFWQETTATYDLTARQIVLDGIPSTSEVLSFLIENEILDISNRKRYGKCFSEEDEYSSECVNPSYSRGFCQTNESLANQSSSQRYPLPGTGINTGQKKRKQSWLPKRFSSRETIGNLTVLTDNDWSAVVEASPTSRKQFHLQEDVFPILNLVVFIRKDCRYCEMVIPSLEKLAKSILYIDGAALYLVNCSSSPTICGRYDIRGYPSIKLFRTIPWVSGCLTEQYNKPYIVQDFHGPFQPYELILEWLSNASLPVIKKDFLLNDVPQKLNHDVFLVGTVITRSHAIHFIPSASHNKWYSLKCFQTVCELLFGKAVCYVTMTKDFGVSPEMQNTKNSELFVIKLDLFRRDGVQAKIFELGVSLQQSLDHERTSEIHKFHKAHRYSLPRGFVCEENHSLCTEFIVKYVHCDHSRLPVTRITHDGFHTVKRFVTEDNSSSLTALPIVIVLAHQQNLSSSSLYFKEITKAAYELYRDVIFTALDVDEYPWWASRFVPKEYDTLRPVDDLSTPPLYHFPRVCVVMSTDHRKAAFFPSLEDMSDAKNIPNLLQNVTAKNIVEFVRLYLLNPQSMLVKTKEF